MIRAFGTQCAYYCRHAAEQPAAAHANHNVFHIRHVFHDFQPARPLPRNNAVVVISGNKRRAGFQRPRFPRCHGFIEIAPAQHHFRSITPGRLYFGDTGKFRHKHRRRNSCQPSGKRNALRMVARACRNHAHRFFFSRQV